MCLFARGCHELVFHPYRVAFKTHIWLQRWMTLVLLFSVIVHFIRSLRSLSRRNCCEQETQWQHNRSILVCKTSLNDTNDFRHIWCSLACSYGTLVLRSSFLWAVIHSQLQVKNREIKNGTAYSCCHALQTHSKDLAGKRNSCLSCKQTKWRLNRFILSVHDRCNELSPWLRFYPKAWLIALQAQGPFLSVPS